MALEFGIFDHVDRNDLPLTQFYEDRLKLIEAYDRAGIYGYHCAEHHSTPLGMSPSPSVYLAAVAQRTKEIGIRAALGAAPADIVRTVLAQAAMAVGIGLVLGGIAGYAVSGLMRNQIYGISLVDPGAYAVALCLLAASAAMAGAAPVRRALRVNPVDALRHE